MPRKTSYASTAPFGALSHFNEAAARCRGKRKVELPEPVGRHTSMRPRLDAAENAVDASTVNRQPAYFNEAAARCRGKPPLRHSSGIRTPTSMRPRLDAAENIQTLVLGRPEP